MRFNGRNFTICANVVTLPTRDEEGNLMPYVDADKENYVYFGRFFNDRRKTHMMVKTTMKFKDTEEPVYAIPIASNGYSLTNMMYGIDGYMYLALNGKCYRAKTPSKMEFKDAIAH